MSTIKTFGAVDQRSLEQLKRCMEAGDAEFGVLCADHHPGYAQPIRGAIAYEGYVSPSGVGFDVACGNKAAQTDMTVADLEERGGVETIMREISARVASGTRRRRAFSRSRRASPSTPGHTRAEMDSPPVLFEIDSELGQSYIAAMDVAGDYPMRAATSSSTRCSTSSVPKRPTRSTTTTTSPGARRTSAATTGSSARAARRRDRVRRGSWVGRWATSR